MHTIKINGRFFGLTLEGRFRKNWKNIYRKDVAFKDTAICKWCGKEKKLTTHHNPSLSISLENLFVRICEECHLKFHKENHLPVLPFIIKCVSGWYNHFLEIKGKNYIYCYKCHRHMNLEKKEEEYIIINENNCLYNPYKSRKIQFEPNNKIT